MSTNSITSACKKDKQSKYFQPILRLAFQREYLSRKSVSNHLLVTVKNNKLASAQHMGFEPTSLTPFGVNVLVRYTNIADIHFRQSLPMCAPTYYFIQSRGYYIGYLYMFVEAVGIEPTTFCVQGRRSSQLS